MTGNTDRIPAIVNARSGTASAAREALTADDAFVMHEVDPADIAATVTKLVSSGARRVLVAGGDGTIGTAASALQGSETELAILPGGTLNHFATDLQIPIEPADALSLARSGIARPEDVGLANDRVFLNTSSVGAYVHFVRTREFLERRFGYRVASAIAAFRILFQLRLIAVELEVDGQRRIYRTPIVFIGTHERELKLPLLGKRVPEGQRGLHVMIVRGRSAGRLLAMALNAVARGVETVSRTPEMDSFIVDRCSITMRQRSTIAIDGELMAVGKSVEYQLERGAVRVVCP